MADEWVYCTECERRIAKRLENSSRYEVKHKGRRSIVAISTEYCPRCGTANPLPPNKRTGTEKKRPTKAQVISRPAEAT